MTGRAPFPVGPRDAMTVALAALLAVTAPAAGQDFSSEPGYAGGSVFFDQDLWSDWLSNEDRNYTMGLGFVVRGRWAERAPTAVVHFGIDRLLRLEPDPFQHRSFHSMMLAGSAFTPDNLLATEPVVGDRPYASLVAFQTRRVRVDDSGRVAWTTEFIIAALGLKVGPEIQKWIHRTNDLDMPSGWAHQISAGGEPTAAYHVAYDRQLLPRRFIQPGTTKHFDLQAGLDGWLGYYTNASAGLGARVGWFRSEFWEFASAPLSGFAQAAGMNRRLVRPEVFLFAGGRGRAVLYNALLQGQFRESDYTLEDDDVRRLLGEFQGGIAAAIPAGDGTLSLSYLVSGRTSELNTDFARTHIWGSLFLTFALPLLTPGPG